MVQSGFAFFFLFFLELCSARLIPLRQQSDAERVEDRRAFRAPLGAATHKQAHTTQADHRREQHRRTFARRGRLAQPSPARRLRPVSMAFLSQFNHNRVCYFYDSTDDARTGMEDCGSMHRQDGDVLGGSAKGRGCGCGLIDCRLAPLPPRCCSARALC